MFNNTNEDRQKYPLHVSSPTPQNNLHVLVKARALKEHEDWYVRVLLNIFQRTYGFKDKRFFSFISMTYN